MTMSDRDDPVATNRTDKGVTMRIRTILAAAAVPAALTAALLGTTGASAATAATHAATLTAATNSNANPGNGAVVIKTQAQADQLMAQGGTINKNVDVPQGANVQLRWVDIKGNLSVEGTLSLASSQIEGNAEVSGPGAGLSLFNDPGNHFWRNLTVNGSFTYSGNALPYPGGLTAGGQQNIS